MKKENITDPIMKSFLDEIDEWIREENKFLREAVKKLKEQNKWMKILLSNYVNEQTMNHYFYDIMINGKYI